MIDPAVISMWSARMKERFGMSLKLLLKSEA